MYTGSSISRRIRGRSMYSFARGQDDEFSSLVPRTSTSAPSNTGLYQNDDEELILKYGAVETSTVPRSNSSGNNSDKRGFMHL